MKTEANIEAYKAEVRVRINELNSGAWENRSRDFLETYRISSEALVLAGEIEYPNGIADALRNLGYSTWRMGDYATSLDHSTEATAIYKKLGDRKGEADVLNSIGAVYAFQGDHENRLKCNLRCLELREQTGDRAGYFASMNNTGETYMELGDYERAITYFERIINNPEPDDTIKAWGHYNLAEIGFRKENYVGALGSVELCLELTEKEKYLILACTAGILYARILQYLNEKNRALNELKKCFDLAEKIQATEQVYQSALLISNLLEEEGNSIEALQYHKVYHETYLKIFNESNTRKIKSLQLKHEAETLRQENEIERLRNIELKKAFDEIEEQRNEISEKNKELTDSIRYARRIQEAILPPEDKIQQYFPDSFIFYSPRDIVSGDFYWFYANTDYIVFACADCTGHGVPGAFMSMIGNDLLHVVIRDAQIKTPGDALSLLNKKLLQSFGSRSDQDDIRDGMDIALCVYHRKTGELEFSGAQRPMLIVRDGEIIEIKGTKASIGGVQNSGSAFSNHKVETRKGDMIYLFTDGFSDQFGGPKGKKFKYRRFCDLITSLARDTVSTQRARLEETFLQWKGNLGQVDDVCVMGIQI